MGEPMNRFEGNEDQDDDLRAGEEVRRSNSSIE
jgi:hypothetical protein